MGQNSGRTNRDDARRGGAHIEALEPRALFADAAHLKDVAAAFGSTTPIVEAGGVGYFVAHPFEGDTVLWRTNGSPDGTYAVKTLASALHDGFQIVKVLTANGRVFISTQAYASTGGALWVSDGTEAGTRRLGFQNVAVDQYSHTNTVEAVGDAVFFVNGRDLMKTDGTDAGTVLVRRINPSGTREAYPAHLAGVNDTLFFTAGGGTELWKSDGTTAGTTLISQKFTYAPSANLTAFGDTLLFYAAEPDDKTLGHLYRSDGTAGGTVPLQGLDLAYGTHQIRMLAALNGRQYFEVLADAPRRGLWVTDGTSAGTQRVTSGYGEVLGALGPTVYLGADNGGGIGRELLRTNGTAAGTALVMDVRRGDEQVSPRPIGASGGFLYFAHADADFDVELWRTDGTAAGTMIAADLVPGAGGSSPQLGGTVGGALLFFANTADGNLALYRVTSAGGAITGQVFEDPSGDGVRQPSELGAEGWRVFIDGDHDGICDKNEPQVRTDADGRYSLDGVPVGTYWLAITTVGGWQATTGSAALVMVKRGGVTQHTFGVRPTAPVFGRVSGFVFEDTDSDGILHPPAGDAGLLGYRVFMDLNFNGWFDAATEPTMRSLADGSYAIERVAPGRYHVAMVQVGGDRVMTTPAVRAVTVRADGTATVHFGVRRDPSSGTIHGNVFIDANNNAKLDVREQPAEGFRVYLDLNNNVIPDAGEPSTRTGNDGSYSFSGLRGGTYRIRQVAVGGDWEPTTTLVWTVNLPIGGSSVRDFGTRLIYTGTVIGALYHDAYSPTDEPPRVYVDINGDNVFGTGEPIVEPDPRHPDFVINGVRPGTYALRVILPDAGWIVLTPPAETMVTVGENETVFRTLDVVRGATINGTLFDDILLNHKVDAAWDRPLAGLGVYLDLNRNAKRDRSERLVVTDSDGRYEFTGLAPGEYQVRINGVPPTMKALSPVSRTITVNAGGTATTNFALATTATMSGGVFWDVNGNGTRGGVGEDPFTNQLLFVDVDDDGIQDSDEPSARTNQIGSFIIRGVPLGDFNLRLAPDGKYGDYLLPQSKPVSVSAPERYTVLFPQPVP